MVHCTHTKSGCHFQPVFTQPVFTQTGQKEGNRILFRSKTFCLSFVSLYYNMEYCTFNNQSAYAEKLLLKKNGLQHVLVVAISILQLSLAEDFKNKCPFSCDTSYPRLTNSKTLQSHTEIGCNLPIIWLYVGHQARGSCI